MSGPNYVAEANARASAAAAAAFGRGPMPPPLSTATSAVDQMEALVNEYRELLVSRRGESLEKARNAAVVERVLMSDRGVDGRSPLRVTKPERLRKLREAVEALRAEVPLSAGQPQDPPQVTQAMADESAARAFGRTTTREGTDQRTAGDDEDAYVDPFGRTRPGGPGPSGSYRTAAQTFGLDLGLPNNADLEMPNGDVYGKELKG